MTTDNESLTVGDILKPGFQRSALKDQDLCEIRHTYNHFSRPIQLWLAVFIKIRLSRWVPGHFAERHFAERRFAERTFCRRTLSRTDILSNGQYDERTFRRKDILPKRQLAENREILGIVTHFSKMCNSQSLCNYKITIVRSLPYMTLHNGSLAAHNDYY